MEIGSTFGVQSLQNITGANRAMPMAAPRELSGKSLAGGDSVTLSPAARLAQSTATDRSNDSASSGPIRFDLVNRVRAEIAAGTYDTPDKLSLAFDRMLASAMR